MTVKRNDPKVLVAESEKLVASMSPKTIEQEKIMLVDALQSANVPGPATDFLLQASERATPTSFLNFMVACDKAAMRGMPVTPGMLKMLVDDKKQGVYYPICRELKGTYSKDAASTQTQANAASSKINKRQALKMIGAGVLIPTALIESTVAIVDKIDGKPIAGRRVGRIAGEAAVGIGSGVSTIFDMENVTAHRAISLLTPTIEMELGISQPATYR